MSKKRYCRLNEGVSIFFDATTRFKITNKEVKEVTNKEWNSKRFQKYLKGGALVSISESEYKEALEEKEKPTKADKKGKGSDDDIKKLNEKLEWVKNSSGWEIEDINEALKIQDLSDLEKFITKTEKAYN